MTNTNSSMAATPAVLEPCSEQRAVARLARNDPSLKDVNLRSYDIGAAGAEALAGGLRAPARGEISVGIGGKGI